MQRSRFSRIFVKAYPRVPFRGRILGQIVQAEGGEMYSLTLRDILDRYHGVRVGNFSYGSLLRIGYCDANTDIGAYVSIGPNVRRFGAAHPLKHAALHPLFYNPSLGLVGPEHDVVRASCWIGHDAWIGANVTILPGCRRIGIGAVIGAGSVVTRDVEDFEIVAGNPARPMRASRFTPEDKARIYNSEFWAKEPDAALMAVIELNKGLK